MISDNKIKINSFGLYKKKGVNWNPVKICYSHLKCEENDPFENQKITDDIHRRTERWCAMNWSMHFKNIHPQRKVITL